MLSLGIDVGKVPVRRARRKNNFSCRPPRRCTQKCLGLFPQILRTLLTTKTGRAASSASSGGKQERRVYHCAQGQCRLLRRAITLIRGIENVPADWSSLVARP